MPKKWKIVFVTAVALTVIQIALRIFTSPSEVVLNVSGVAPSDMYLYYTTNEINTHHDSQVLPCKSDYNRRFFPLPEKALTDAMRFDFGQGYSSFRLHSITMRHHYFFTETLSAEDLYDLYLTNPMVSWVLQDGYLEVKTTPNDPFIVPKNGKLAEVPLSAISYQAILNQLIFFITYLLIGAGILSWKKLTGLYETYCKPYRWFPALLIFFGCLTFLFTDTVTWKLTPQYGRACGLTLIFFVILRIVDWRMTCREKEKALTHPAEPKKKRQFDMAMVYFRAFAIGSIVIGHYLDVSGWYFVSQSTEKIAQLSHALFSNDTIYFLFISGYLFYYVTDQFSGHWENWKFIKDRGKFNLPVFYRKKVTNVIFPYIFISVLIGFYILATGDYSGFVGNSFQWADFPNKLLNGGMQMQFWYIPFIIIVFLFAPLLLILPRKLFFGILILAATCSLTIPRPADMLTLDGFLFFIFSYLFGVWYAMEKEKLFEIFKTYFWFFLTAAVVCSFFVLIYEHLHEQFSVITTLHKWTMIPVVIVLLEKIKDKKFPLLTNIANLSFTLYFLHMIIIQKLFIKMALTLTNHNVILPIEICLIRTAAAVIFLLLLSWSLKVLTGRFSRSLIGS